MNVPERGLVSPGPTSCALTLSRIRCPLVHCIAQAEGTHEILDHKSRGSLPVKAADQAFAMLTTRIRKDRSCEGHLQAMFANGHLPTLLQWLEVIRAEL